MIERSSQLSRKKKLVFSFVVFLIPVTTISGIYLAYAAYRTMPVYRYVKSNQRGWKGRTHIADAELGFAPIPDSEGAEVFPIGNDIPARFDKDGFRVPLEAGATAPNRSPVVLTLGCSFTYGAATAAENTYPY